MVPFLYATHLEEGANAPHCSTEDIVAYGFLDIALTPSVAAAQARMGSEGIWQNFKGNREFKHFSADEIAFITARDSFYIASISETGWPYIQHRGGPVGFLKAIDDRTLALADYRGNLQYISAGNLAASDRACLFLMDYTTRSRLKIYARIERLSTEADPDLTSLVTDVEYKAKLDGVFRIHLEAFDWNCQQHIARRFGEQEVVSAIVPLRDQVIRLEAENASLRAQLACTVNI